MAFVVGIGLIACGVIALKNYCPLSKVGTIRISKAKIIYANKFYPRY